MAQIVKRRYVETDKIEFNDKNLNLLKQAQQDICFLLDRGYEINKVIEFIGNHFLFSARQRLALKRSLSSSLDIKRSATWCHPHGKWQVEEVIRIQ